VLRGAVCGVSEGKVCGALVTYHTVKATKYRIKNNEPAGRAPKRVHIDHTADSAHGGYVSTVPVSPKLPHQTDHLCLIIRLMIND
jgi:hypothetical protein